MTRVVATPDESTARAELRRGALGVALYHVGGADLPGVGHHIPKQVEFLPRSATAESWDFLSIALAVFAADRFVLRSEAPDGWTRTIDLHVSVAKADTWARHSEQLAAALGFLTGDFWSLTFDKGGMDPPEFEPRETDRDCACLFSGGLDSLIGVLDLLGAGHRPLLVSQASPKEGPYQVDLARRIGLADHRFEARVTERYQPPYEPSTRARSLLFFAYGVLGADTLSMGKPVELVVPENGFIGLNPPLTARRIGSLSTRTTHPHFTSAVQDVLKAVGIPVTMVFPYLHKTKGEMLAKCRDKRIRALAHRSYSCGKGKRLNQQCGRCLPCLVRRAAFRKAALVDRTDYKAKDLAYSSDNDDVAAVRMACARSKMAGDALAWARQSGPLPGTAHDQKEFGSVVKRGASELDAFLARFRWK